MALRIDGDLCEATGACESVCPEDVIDFTSGRPVIVNLRGCTSCWICVENCASGAIELD